MLNAKNGVEVLGSLFFAIGSAVGAALAWFVGRLEPSRSTGFALNGITCGLLGALTSASGDTNPPANEAWLGLLGTAAPLTSCMPPLRAVASSAGISSVARYLAVTLALALVSGISCATLGFVLVESARHISDKENVGKSVDPIMISLKPFHPPDAAFPRRL
jgi:hypothetical protein